MCIYLALLGALAPNVSRTDYFVASKVDMGVYSMYMWLPFSL